MAALIVFALISLVVREGFIAHRKVKQPTKRTHANPVTGWHDHSTDVSAKRGNK